MAAGFIAVSVVAFIVLGSVLEGIPAIVLFGSVLLGTAVAKRPWPQDAEDCRDERRVHPDRRQRLARRDLVAARGARTRLTISLKIVEIADDGTTIMWRSVMPKAKLLA